jgi:hypothetical protein
MLVTKTYSENSEINLRLLAFDVTRNELVAVARAVVAARADTTDNDPATAEGQLAYIYGTRALVLYGAPRSGSFTVKKTSKPSAIRKRR